MPEVEGPMDPIDPPPGDPSTSRKRPLWFKDILEDVERHIASRGTFRESKKSKRYQGYLVAKSIIVQTESCTFEEDVKHQVWKDVMNEEYESIMKMDVWDVVPRPKDKFVVTSKWLYKIKHGVDWSAEKHKARFVARGFSQKEGVDYDRYLHRLPNIQLYDLLLLLLPLKDDTYIKWTSRLLSCMARLRRKSTWNNLMGSKYMIKGHTYAG